MSSPFIDRRELSAMLGGLSTETLRTYVKRGVLPAPIALSQRRKLWDRATVVAFLNARKGPVTPASTDTAAHE